MKYKNSVLALILTIYFTIYCDGQSLRFFPDSLNGKKLSMAKWIRSLDTIFPGNTAGWAYEIMQGQTVVVGREGGYAIAPSDLSGNMGVLFTSSTRMHIASLSKTITALAMEKLLHEKKLDWETKARPFLPSHWILHAGFKDLTIKQLLKMESGLNAPLNVVTSSIDSLRTFMQNGPDKEKVGKFNYQNTSYGLMRIVMGYILGYKEITSDSGDVLAGIITANLYKDYVRKKILEPAGIQDGTCAIGSGDPVMMYPSPFNNEKGKISGTAGKVVDGDLTKYAGGFGWYLSVKDISKLMYNLVETEKILSKNELAELIALGFPLKVNKTKYGEYLQSGGDWRWIEPGMKYTVGLQTSFFIFPGQLRLIVFHNSAFNARGAIMNSYLQAFE